MKAFTDLEQSKKLAEILPIESADMCYIKHASSNNPAWRFDNDIPPMILGDVPINEITAETLPCWSLAALVDVLPLEVETHKQTDGHKIYYYLESYMQRMGKEIYLSTKRHDNSVDACVEMILKLKDMNIL